MHTATSIGHLDDSNTTELSNYGKLMKRYTHGDSLYKTGLFETYCFIATRSEVYHIYLFRNSKGIFDLIMENLYL